MTLENPIYTPNPAPALPVTPNGEAQTETTDQEKPSDPVSKVIENSAIKSNPLIRGLLSNTSNLDLEKNDLFSKSSSDEKSRKAKFAINNEILAFYQYLLTLLSEADADGDGKISFKEMEKLIAKINRAFLLLELILDPTNAEAAAKLLADTDKDGVISGEEKEFYEDLKVLFEIAYSDDDIETKRKKIIAYMLLKFLLKFIEEQKESDEISKQDKSSQDIEFFEDLNSIPVPTTELWFDIIFKGELLEYESVAADFGSI